MLVSVKITRLLTLLIRPRVRQNKASSETNNRTAGSSEKTVTTTSKQLEIQIWLRRKTLTIVNISECWVMPCCDDMHRLYSIPGIGLDYSASPSSPSSPGIRSHLGWISGLLIENIDLVTRNWDQQKAENSLRSFPEPRPNFDVQFDFKI